MSDFNVLYTYLLYFRFSNGTVFGEIELQKLAPQALVALAARTFEIGYFSGAGNGALSSRGGPRAEEGVACTPP